jgi:hypothetical protein
VVGLSGAESGLPRAKSSRHASSHGAPAAVASGFETIVQPPRGRICSRRRENCEVARAEPCREPRPATTPAPLRGRHPPPRPRRSTRGHPPRPRPHPRSSNFLSVVNRMDRAGSKPGRIVGCRRFAGAYRPCPRPNPASASVFVALLRGSEAELVHKGERTASSPVRALPRHSALAPPSVHPHLVQPRIGDAHEVGQFVD